MPELRQQDHYVTESLIANQAIDITAYDRVGRFTTDGEAQLCAANETPQFIFTESAAAHAPVRVAFFQSCSGQARVMLSGAGNAGDKLSVGANGVILVSGTAQDAEADEDDIGIALADWTDGDETGVFFIKGSQV